MEILIFCGLQGSGKSSYYKTHFADTHLRVNLDMLRTRRREQAIFEACLRVGQRLVVDNTNVSREARALYLAAALKANFQVVAYVFDVPFDICAARNAARVGRARVSDAGLRSMAKQMRAPTFDEGFQRIITVDSTGEIATTLEAE